MLRLALAMGEVRRRLARTGHLLEIDDQVVAKGLGARLCHDVEVVFVAIIVLVPRFGAPLLVAVIRTKVGQHDNNRLAVQTASSLTRGGRAGRSELVA